MAENEIKYVVRGYPELEALLTPRGWQDIEQGYLNPNARVRRVTNPDGQQSFIFTYKQRMPNGHNLEIEASMSETEFEEAWEYTIERLTKRRISINQGVVRWDIDFYRWSAPYFVLAEVEMPGDMCQPDTIPRFLDIAYEVPRNDNRFAARRLADEDHVRAMARELGLGPLERVST
jgi:CYTH domain-containing protein